MPDIYIVPGRTSFPTASRVNHHSVPHKKTHGFVKYAITYNVRCKKVVVIQFYLSPDWVGVFKRYGWEAVHWSSVGDPQANDFTLMEWARANNYIVFTHDLDFGAILAVTHAEGPSVFQIRTQDVTPNNLEKHVFNILHQYQRC